MSIQEEIDKALRGSKGRSARPNQQTTPSGAPVPDARTYTPTQYAPTPAQTGAANAVNQLMPGLRYAPMSSPVPSVIPGINTAYQPHHGGDAQAVAFGKSQKETQRSAAMAFQTADQKRKAMDKPAYFDAMAEGMELTAKAEGAKRDNAAMRSASAKDDFQSRFNAAYAKAANNLSSPLGRFLAERYDSGKPLDNAEGFFKEYRKLPAEYHTEELDSLMRDYTTGAALDAMSAQAGGNSNTTSDQALMYRDMAEYSRLPKNVQDAIVGARRFAQSVHTDENGQENVFSIYEGMENDRPALATAKQYFVYQGLTDAEAAKKVKELTESLTRYENMERTEQTRKKYEEKDGSFGANLASIGQNFAGAVTSAISAASDFGNSLHSRYATGDPNLPGYLPGVAASTTRAVTAENIQNRMGGLWGKSAAFVYNAAMSGLDNLARHAATLVTGIPSASLFLAASGGFSSGYQDAVARGANPAQAATMGIVEGAAEVLTEKLDVDRFIELQKGGAMAKWWFDFLVKSPLSEIGEEELSEIANNLADSIVMGDMSKDSVAIRQYMDNGMSYQQAKEQVYREAIQNYVEVAASTYLSTLVSTAPAGVQGYKNAKAEQRAERAAQAMQTAEPTPPPANPIADAVEKTVNPNAQQKTIDESPAAAYTETEQQAQERQRITQPIQAKGGTVGRADTTYTPDNKPMQIHYAVIPADNLIVSNDEWGGKNASYPAELQPRDRTRATSQAQVHQISKGIVPEKLAASAHAEQGAPIIRSDGVVISGNGRSQGVITAYKNGNADNYRQYIMNHAAEFGLDTAAMPENPVLVRVADEGSDWKQLSRILNKTDTAVYSASETAKVDSDEIRQFIGLLRPGADGNLNASSNDEFVRMFRDKVVSDAEMGNVFQDNGRLTRFGKIRLENAIFHLAYGNERMLDRIAEDDRDTAVRLTTALQNAAPMVARLMSEISSGDVMDMGLSHSISNAIDLFMEAKAGKAEQSRRNLFEIADRRYVGPGEVKLRDGESGVRFTGFEVQLAKAIQDSTASSEKLQTLIESLAAKNATYAKFSLYGDLGEIDAMQFYKEAAEEAERVSEEKRSKEKAKDGTPKKGYKYPVEESIFQDYGRSTRVTEAASVDGEGVPGTVAGTLAEDGQGRPDGVRTDNESVLQDDGRKGPGTVTPDSSVGAAPAGFDPYSEAQYKYGNLPDRANDSRPVNVPAKVEIDGKPTKVSESASNIYGAEITPDSFIPKMEKAILDGKMSFESVANQSVVDDAVKHIERVGYNKAIGEVAQAATKRSVSPRTIAVAEVLYNTLVNSGDKADTASAVQVLEYIAQISHTTGQNLQLFKMFRKLSPEGKLDSTIASIEAAVERYNKKYRNEGNKVQWEADPAMKAELLSALKSGSQDRIDAAIRALQMDAASSMKATFREKWDNWRYMAMLTNLKTHVRNTLGNASFQPMAKLSRRISALAQTAVAQENRRIALLNFSAEDRALRSWAKDDAVAQLPDNVLSSLRSARLKLMNGADGVADSSHETAVDAIQGGNKYQESAGDNLDQFRKIFRTDAINKISNADSAALSMEDTIFKRLSYADTLAMALKARGITAEMLKNGTADQETVDKARIYAGQVALEDTFNDMSALARMATGMRFKGDSTAARVGNMLIEGIMPFKKTPANIVTRIAEYSPIGLAKSIYDGAAKVSRGTMDASTFIDGLSKGITGTAAFALGSMLMSMGIITPGKPDDEEKLQGIRGWALHIGDTYYDLSWLSPTMVPVFMGVEAANIMRENTGKDATSYLLALMESGQNIFDPVLELSMLSSLNDLISEIQYKDDTAGVIAAILSSMGVSYIMQGIPTLFRQFDTAADENRKIVFADSDNEIVRGAQRVVGQAFQKLPGDFFQTEAVDRWGRKDNKGSIGQRIWDSFINPGFSSRQQTSAADEAITRLNKTQEINVTPSAASKTLTVKDENGETKRLRLTASQWTDYQTTKGQLAYDMENALVSSEAFTSLPDEAQAKALEFAEQFADQLGRMKALPDSFTEPSEKWMRDLEGDTGEAAVAAILRKAQLWDTGASETRFDKAVEQGFTQEQMRNMFRTVKEQTDSDGNTTYDTYRAVLAADPDNAEKWLSVYGMSDTQLKGLSDAVKKGYTAESYVDALESSHAITSAFTNITQAWKDNATPDVAALETAYSDFRGMDARQQALIKNQLSGRTAAFVNAAEKGVKADTFLAAYKEHQSLADSNFSVNDQADRFAAYLDRQVASHALNQRQADGIFNDLGFFQQMRQDASKYYEIRENGASISGAERVAAVLMSSLKPLPGTKTVTDYQRYEAIMDDSVLSDSDKEAAVRSYLDEKPEAKLDWAMDNIGITFEDYMKALTMWHDTDSMYSGDGKKAFRTSYLNENLDIDKTYINTLVDLFSGKIKIGETDE